MRLKHLLTAISCLLAFSLTAQEVVVEYPYNPDFENDGNVGVEDLMELLATFGMGFDVDELTIDEVALSEWLQVINQTLIDQQVAIDSLSNILADLGDGQAFSSPCEGAEFVDYHGHSYGIVEIGNQCWFSENLATLTYNSGAEIDSSNTDFDAFDPAWISINSDLQHVIEGELGHYYSYGTVYNTNELCPLGWHVPSIADWIEFAEEVTVDMGGYYLKDSTEWEWYGINSFGFSAMPGGYARTNLIWPDWDWQFECDHLVYTLYNNYYYWELEAFMGSINWCQETFDEEFDECQNSIIVFIDSLSTVYDFEWNDDLFPFDNYQELYEMSYNDPSLAPFFVLETCNSLEEAIELFQIDNDYYIENEPTQAQWWIRAEINSLHDEGGVEFSPATVLLTPSFEIKGLGEFTYGNPGVNFQVRCIKD